jgi:hypothetical protein
VSSRCYRAAAAAAAAPAAPPHLQHGVEYLLVVSVFQNVRLAASRCELL